jgi:hypothetical protein
MQYATKTYGEWKLWEIKKKSHVPAGNRIPAVQPVARCYTDWPVSAHKQIDVLYDNWTFEVAEKLLQMSSLVWKMETLRYLGESCIHSVSALLLRRNVAASFVLVGVLMPFPIRRL